MSESTSPTLSADEVARLGELLRADAKSIREHVPDAEGSFRAVAVSAADDARRTVAGPLHADMLDEAATAIETLLAERDACEVRLERARAALEKIDEFDKNYFAPWGSWKTAWWEGEVSDDAEFCDGNALKHVISLARAAAAFLAGGGS